MARQDRPHYEGDPSLLRVMLQLRWIAALVLAIAVAAGFAWLGRWQLGHAIRIQHDDTTQSEVVRPLAELTDPGTSVTDLHAGMVVSLSGTLVHGDFELVAPRENQGTTGVWVTGHLAVAGETPSSLAVALGWAPTPAAATQAIAALEADDAVFTTPFALEGRYMPSDGTEVPRPDQDPQAVLTMTTAQLINLWAPFTGPAYGGYLVVHPIAPFDTQSLAGYGLDVIDSVPPLPPETVNWLNIFYAAEWVVFAGFAIFFWFRLVRDAWERIHELRLLTEAEAEPPSEP